MKPINDYEYHGHELVIVQDNESQLYAVDIREDNFDGAFIEGYEGFATELDAKRAGEMYIDGMRASARKVQANYELTAGVLNLIGYANAGNEYERMVTIIGKQLAEQFQKRDKQFNSAEFLEQCGITEQ